jgi:hypothetical protein
MADRETFFEFIARRRRELDDEEAALRDRLAAIASEREYLRSAERISFGEKTPPREVARAIRKRRKGIKAGTIMDRVINILRRHPDGLTASAILFGLNLETPESPLARESLSPQLSRLKQAGYIELDGSIWRLSQATNGVANG